MRDEWTTVISGDRLVKFTYVDLSTGASFMTAQIAGHEVVYSLISEQPEGYSRVGVEGRFPDELRPIPPLRHYPTAVPCGRWGLGVSVLKGP